MLTVFVQAALLILAVLCFGYAVKRALRQKKIDCLIFLLGGTLLVLAEYFSWIDGYWLSVIKFMGLNVIFAASLNLVNGYMGEFSCGHAGFMCVGAYLGCYLANQLHTVIGSPLVVLIISMLAGGIIAAVFGLIIGLPALRLRGDYLAIVTLAFGEIVRTVFKNLDTFGGALGLSTKKYGTNLFIVALIVVLIMLILVQNLIRSRHGRAITAIRDNEIAAKAMGINVTRCSYL